MVNPTGKLGAFRAADWVQEHNNLKTKVLFGGSYANYTKKRVLDESCLINVYHSCHVNIEKNLVLRGLTTRHTPPDMSKTFEVLARYMRTHRPNEHTPGRTMGYRIPDTIMKGMAELLTMEKPIAGDVNDEEVVEDIDILGEL